MRDVDRVATELGLTLTRMMENAGANLAWLASVILGGDGSGRRITVLAGPVSCPIYFRAARLAGRCDPHTQARVTPWVTLAPCIAPHRSARPVETPVFTGLCGRRELVGDPGLEPGTSS
jgi:hypothetical protein